ncbi:hypothetical protein BD779DRAFT_1492379 [Infundibulicybe gibba]|nr:hypothetical protein BD779DRAFT_1492379 [Infundibulicybe gibba]
MEGSSISMADATNTNGAFSLENILGENHETIEHPGIKTPPAGWDEDIPEKPVTEGFCIECEDQPAEVLCETCSDSYCEVCFASQHRKADAFEKNVEEDTNGQDSDDEDWERVIAGPSIEVSSAQPAIGTSVGEWFIERAKFIPLRLTITERKYLRLLEAALSVSEYTDKIDTLGFGLSKAKRIVHQIRELCAIMSGLLLSADYKQGQELFNDRDFEANAEFYQQIFELGRRHKIMNPDKMRTTYGKLIYLLQDRTLNFSCVRPIKTCGGLDLLRDDLISVATKEIYSEGRPRRDIQKDIKNKERAIETLASRYQRKDLSQENIRQCLYSIGDNHAFLRANRDPCERMIGFLKQYFHPTTAADSKTRARLSHDHSKQYAYVLQSLTLWREILHDLLAENIPYRLRDTGQGLNRVQAAPKTSRMMHNILYKAQKSCHPHGDHNVPNALLFIDKYTQIYRILLPICNTLSQIPSLVAKPAIRSYIDDEFGSPENLILEILGDFFRHGFDGSGADNFFDAGSCIDGRLTSAWNWCSTLEKKRYFPIFLLTVVHHQFIVLRVYRI